MREYLVDVAVLSSLVLLGCSASESDVKKSTGGNAGSAAIGSGVGGNANGGATISAGGTSNAGAAGNAGSGGVAGDTSSANAGSTGCGVPASFEWTSSDVLIEPVSDATHNLASIKDPTVVRYDDKWHVYATAFNATTSLFNMVYLNFADWSEAKSAPQYHMDQTAGFGGYRCAPQIFYFTPQAKWYLIYQTQPPAYSTNSDPSKPEAWTAPQPFYASEPAIVTQNKGSGFWIDYWVICDDGTCHMFFSDDNGNLYRSQTAKSEFPNGFGDPVIVMSEVKNDLFEAANVYRIKGLSKYLLIVEAIGNGRYFRSWTADTLDGKWTPVAATQSNPFAGSGNVTFTGTKWASGISHGEMLRDGYDETLTIDTCSMQYLYQGLAPGSSGEYNLLPYKLGLLTAVN